MQRAAVQPHQLPHSGHRKRYNKALPPDAVVLNVTLQKELYAWVHGLARFYRVSPGAIVERGIRVVARRARRLGIGEDFEGLPPLRKTVKR
jgi:hypothetical protein